MKAVLTVVGKDKPGIIASVSSVLAENKVNIEDISQTIMQDKFTMIMYVNIANAKISLGELKSLMNDLGEKIGVNVHVQHEDIFNAMHKI
jgi:ACT domain-containing protein